jgi:hypothetical protein
MYLIESKCKVAQMLELTSKDFEAAIINMANILMGKTFKGLRESIVICLFLTPGWP